MEKNLGMVGMGRVTNGVMVFSDATGKGFAKKISATEVAPVVAPVVTREPAIKREVSMTKEDVVLDVPAFMKGRKVEPRGQVIYANFSKEDDEQSSEDIADILEAVVDAAKKVVTRNPVFKYFFGEEE